VDKGPDVAGTLNMLIEVQRSINCVFLRGNHDQLLIDAFRHPDKVTLWECLAGETPLASYGSGRSEGVLKTIPEGHIEFLERECRDYYETDDFIFVHGGIRPYLNPKDEEIERLQWTTLSLATPHLSGKTIVCGHSSQASGRIADLGHTICIDTGITKGQNLTCLNLDDFSFVQVSGALEVNSGALGGRITNFSQPEKLW
jgi:serine/threonine protein phosphatase 1